MFISGIGAINAFGAGTECLEMLKQNSKMQDGIIGKAALHFVKSKYDLRRADRYTTIVMASAVQACADAGFTDCAPADTGIIIVSAFGPHRTTFAFLNDILDYPEDQVLPTTFSHSVHNAAASYVASSLQIRGPTITLTGFEEVWFDALESSSIFLDSGYCQRILLIGVEELALLTQSLNGILPDSFPCRLLEGSVALLLSSAPEGKNYTAISCRRKFSPREKLTRNPSSLAVNDFLGGVFQTAISALASSRQPGTTISVNSISGSMTFCKTVQ
ncbi:MAG: beta-ketoacyl synthase chain length factor [Lentisphaerae bacterium]|nr:beta-ketoacyl synthase chain length factor [Lentisphaerota bacterium]